jgi:hypothetical protein
MCNIGSTLGGLLGGAALDVLAPEIGIPFSLASALGSGVGSTIGGLASGEKFGQAALGGLESGALSGALSAGGTLLSGGNLASPNSFISDFAGTSTPATGAALTAGEQTAAAGATDAVASALPGISAPATAAGPSAAATTITPPGTAGAMPGSFGASTPASTAAAVGGGSPGGVGGVSGAGGGVSGGTAAGGGGGVSSSMFDSGDMGPAAAAQGDFGGGGPASWSDKLLQFAKSNPGLLLSAAPLAMSLFGSPTQVPAMATVQNQALTDAQNAKAMNTFAATGTLPPGLQSVIDANTAAAKAQVRSSFNNIYGGQKSTAEAEALGAIDQNAAGQTALLAQKFQAMGLDYSKLSQEELNVLLKSQMTAESDFQNAMANLARGIGGLGPAVSKAFGSGGDGSLDALTKALREAA